MDRQTYKKIRRAILNTPLPKSWKVKKCKALYQQFIAERTLRPAERERMLQFMAG